MENLKVLKENALKAYNSADASGKKLLQDLFPGELVPIKVTDRIKTFEDVLTDQQISPADFNKNIANDTADVCAYKKLKLIARALNEGWEPDYTDEGQYKYEPRFYDFKSGFGFSYTHYVSWGTHTLVGSRLVFKSSELALYAGNQFRDIYNEYLT